MKKIISLLLVSLLLLTGCSDKQTTISNSKDVIFTIDGSSYTKGDLYDMIKLAGGADYTVSLAKKTLNAGIEVTDEMRAAAEAELKSLITSSGEEKFNTSLSNAGYDSQEQYLEEVLIPKQQESAAIKAYATTNYETLASTYVLRKVRIIEVKTEALGTEAIAKLKNGSTFSEVAKEYNQSSTYTGTELISTKETTTAANVLPDTVQTQVEALTQPALIETVITDSSKYYVVQVIATSPALFTDEGIALLATLTSVSESFYKEAFANADFTIYDKDIYDEIKANDTYKNYLDQ